MAAARLDAGAAGRVAAGLEGRMGKRLRLQEPLVRHTAFRLGGPADLFAEVWTAAELAELYRLCAAEGLPVFLLGRGTNLLVRDGGFRGAVAVLGGDFEQIARIGEQGGKTLLRAGGGVLNAQLVKYCHHNGLVGLEFLALIPGTVGGAIRMNAGAHGSEIREFVDSADIVAADGRIETRSLDELGLSYRRSALAPGDAVASVDLLVPPGDVGAARERMREFSRHRTATQPLGEPNAGSVFKNPEKEFAGRLIEEAGLKGYRVGGARVSELHANFIVGSTEATAADVEAVIRHVRNKVFERTGIRLELEIRIIGEPAEGSER